MTSTIQSVSSDQSEILNNILILNGLDQFDADITYGNGAFYKKVPQPRLKFDVDPQTPDTTKANSIELPLESDSLNSIVYDPPFLTYIKAAREHNSIMAKRFGGFWKYSELEDHYRQTLAESARVLKKDGILVFKCQDIIHNHSMHPTHINIVNWASNDFVLKDLFILPKSHRLPMPSKAGEKPRQQQHARIHHSYFLVLRRLKQV